MLRGVDGRNSCGDVLRETHFRTGFGTSADRLSREAVAQYGVVSYLVELSIGERQAGRDAKVHLLSPTDVNVDSLMTHIDEGMELVDREEVLDPVAELFCHVTGVLCEGADCVHRLPGIVLVLQCLRQIPVVERRKRLDAGREKLVDQAVVEVQTLGVRFAGALGEDPGQAIENRYAVAPIDFISATSSTYRW
jgi:hypothetical protein